MAAKVASNDSRQKRDRSSCIKRGRNRRIATRSLRVGLVLIHVAFSQDHPVSARRICPRTWTAPDQNIYTAIVPESGADNSV